MVRPPLTDEERARGERLGALLRHARGERALTEIAARAGIPVETLRKIESGRVPTPAFFTVAALATALDLSLDVIAGLCEPAPLPLPLQPLQYS
ncbi:MAG TPA: helix-turn-helix transcriptional regulator [Actinospica sp.]|nr:helix-turn-helix transcriptional regulator [Actinospica sp.]